MDTQTSTKSRGLDGSRILALDRCKHTSKTLSFQQKNTLAVKPAWWVQRNRPATSTQIRLSWVSCRILYSQRNLDQAESESNHSLKIQSTGDSTGGLECGPTRFRLPTGPFLSKTKNNKSDWIGEPQSDDLWQIQAHGICLQSRFL